MSTYKERVEDYIGTFSDTDALDDWLTEGARIVIERLKPEKLAIYATDKTDPDGTTGIALTGGRPLSAHKSGYEARLVPKGMSAAIADGDSIHYALATDPAWYIDLEKGYVFPGGGTVKWFAYPAVAFDDEIISNYPPQGYPAIALYASIQGQLRNITDLMKTTLGGISFSEPSPISAPAAPSFTWTDAVIGIYSATTLGTTATLPTYTKPTVALSSIPDALTITATVPTAPSAPSFTAVSLSAATVTATTIDALMTAPAYSASLPTRISDVVISGTAPTSLTAPSFSYSDAAKVDATWLAALDISTEIGELATFLDTNNDVELSLAKLKEIDTLINEYSLEKVKAQDTLISNAQSEADINKVNATQSLLGQIQEYDGKVKRFQAEVANYRAEIEGMVQEHNSNVQNYTYESQSILQNELNEFNEANAEYQADLLHIIEQAKLTAAKNLADAQHAETKDIQEAMIKLSKEQQEYAGDLGLFSGEIQNYQAEIQEAVAIYSNNLRAWEQERATDLQEYSSDIQNELNEFNKELATYQGVMQQEIKQADLTQTQILKLASDTTELNKFNELQTLAEQVQEYQAVLGKHQSDVANYTSQINGEAQRIQTLIGQHTATNAGYLEVLKNLKEEYSRSLETL